MLNARSKILIPNQRLYIDRGDPINRNQVGCYVLGEGRHTKRYLDLTGNRDGAIIGSNVVNGRDVIGKYTRIGADNVADRIDLGSVTSADRLSGFSSQAISIVVQAYVPSAAGGHNYPRWFDKSTAGNAVGGWAFYPGIAGQEFGFQVNGGAWYSHAFTGNSNSVGVMGASCDSANNNLKTFYNGAQIGLVTSSINTFPSLSANAALLNWNSSDRMYEFPVYVVRVWNRALSSGEMIKLGRDPRAGLIQDGINYFRLSAIAPSASGGALSGDIAAVCTVTGDLTRSPFISGDIAAVCTVTGDLTSTPPAGALSGDITAVCAVTGDLTRSPFISGDITAVCTVTGDLTSTATPGTLAGSITAICTVTGAITKLNRLSGGISVVCTVSGSIPTPPGSIYEEILSMAARKQGRKKSEFPALGNIPGDATFDFVSGGTNYKIPVSDFLASLNVTGTIVQEGSVAGVPILDVDGTVNKIRNVEAGSGIAASVSPGNGLVLTHNIAAGSGGVPIFIDTTETQPIIKNLVAGAGITVTGVTGGVQITRAEVTTGALASMHGNTTDTAIATINTPVIVNAGTLWASEEASGFTISTAGKLTYTGASNIGLAIVVSASIKMATTGLKTVSLYAAIDGVVKTGSATTVQVTDETKNVTLTWRHTFTTGQYLELYIENNSDDEDVLVADAVIVVA